MGNWTGDAVRELPLKPLGYEQITTLSPAVGLTVPDGTIYVLLIAETADVRFRDDGTDPTASVGWPLFKNLPFWYTGQASAPRFIQVDAGAKLNALYYGRD